MVQKLIPAFLEYSNVNSFIFQRKIGLEVLNRKYNVERGVYTYLRKKNSFHKIYFCEIFRILLPNIELNGKIDTKPSKTKNENILYSKIILKLLNSRQ